MTPDEIANLVLEDAPDPHILMGPLVWQPNGKGGRDRYFVLIFPGRGEDGFRINRIDTDSEIVRASILTALVKRPSIAVHDFDDEIEMMKLAETLWPGNRTTRIRQALEIEHAGWEEE